MTELDDAVVSVEDPGLQHRMTLVGGKTLRRRVAPARRFFFNVAREKGPRGDLARAEDAAVRRPGRSRPASKTVSSIARGLVGSRVNTPALERREMRVDGGGRTKADGLSDLPTVGRIAVVATMGEVSRIARCRRSLVHPLAHMSIPVAALGGSERQLRNSSSSDASASGRLLGHVVA